MSLRDIVFKKEHFIITIRILKDNHVILQKNTQKKSLIILAFPAKHKIYITIPAEV